MDDPTAIRRCRAGDKEAFRCLVERYEAEAIGHAIAILGSREDARDAVQESFLSAYLALPRFDLDRRFYPWFYVILRNCCYRMAAARKTTEIGIAEELMILAPTADIQREETMVLERSILELKDEDRELITLRHLDGLSYEELAERLGVPLGTIMSRLYYARKSLREKLTRRGFTRFSLGR